MIQRVGRVRTHRDDRVLLTQGNQVAVVGQNHAVTFLILHRNTGTGRRITHRGGSHPRRRGTETSGRRIRGPLHRHTRIIASLRRHNLQRLLLAQAALTQHRVGVVRLHIHVLLDRGVDRVNHADFLTLVHVRGAAQQVNHGRQHGRRLGTVTLNVTKTVQCARLIVVIPEQCVPAAAGLHTQCPIVQNLLQLGKTERHLRPLLAVLVVHLQVVEAEHHVQLVVCRVGVAHAVFDAGRGHFAHGHGVIMLTERGAVQLLNTGVHNRGVGVLCLVHAAFGGVEQLLALADDVNDVETETAHALLVPEVHDLKQLVAHNRVVPVHVRLGAVVQVHVEQRSAVLIRVLAKAGPAGAAELRLPVGRFA